MALLLEDSTAVLLENGTALLLEGDSTDPTPTPTGSTLRGPAKSSLSTVELYAPTFESLQVDIFCTVDPTGVAPQFAVTAEGEVITSSTMWSDGVWNDDYGTDGWTVARTPAFGASGAFGGTAGRYWVWVKTFAGSEAPTWRIGLVIVL